MANVNPDPRPGRWVLPLVVLGMVVFAYVFVRSLPGAEAGDGDPSAGGGTTTTTATTVAGGTPGDGGDGGTGETTTTAPNPDLDPEVAAYLETMAEFESQILDLQTEMATINGQWDAEPRQIEFDEALDALRDLSDRVQQWSEQVAAVTPPTGLEDSHSTISAIAATLADESVAVVEGLQAPDTGELRRAAVDRFDEAVRAFTAAVDEAEQVAQTLGGGGGDTGG